MPTENNNNNFKLKPWQDNFVFSQKRYPALFSAWGTGKTLALITRAMLYSEHIPNNLGVIFRREFTDLRDSTIKDFERYTGLSVNSSRETVLYNGSTIMFRHLEELNNIQNINLGWFAIEQVDEMPTDREFFVLFGRLRRQVSPDEYFKSLGLCPQTGFVIGNAGAHWGKRVWIDEPISDSDCFQANTFDNIDVLPKEFIDSLEILKQKTPEIYNQFVLNSWDVGDDKWILIKNKSIEALKGIDIIESINKRLVSIDPAMGGDECVIKLFEDTKEIDQLILREQDSMKIVGEVIVFMAKHKVENVVIDAIGIGAPIADRLREIGKNVVAVNCAAAASNVNKFGNLKAEMWFYVMDMIQSKKVCEIKDELTRKQLCSAQYRVVNSNGKIMMEHKSETKKRLGHSPDRADAYVMGIWGLQKITKPKLRSGWENNRVSDYGFNPATV